MDGPSVQTISQAISNPDYWVDKLRFEDPETFKELCGGLLTRFLDLPGPELSRVLGTSPVKDNRRRFLARKKAGGVFGAPLTEEGLAQIHQLIDFLGNHTHVEGIFRIPGNSHRQQRLKDNLNSGVDIDLELGEFTPHDVASVLKIFLGELPEPLLTTRHYPAYLQVPDMMLFEKSVKTDKPNKERQIETYQLLFWLLPNVNRKLLQAVLSLLYKTAQAQKDHKNRMSAHNLGVMFAPHVLWPRSLTIADLKDNVNKLNGAVAFIIKHSQRVFLAPVQLRAQCRLYFAAKEKSEAQQKPASSDDTASPSDEVAQTRAKKRPHEDAAESKTQTDLALAQLYAHVQAMPDSHKKRKYVKQFNEHSNCTPGSPNHKVLPRTRGKHVRSKSWGAAITKLFASNKPQTQTRSGAHSDPRKSSQTPTSDRVEPGSAVTQRSTHRGPSVGAPKKLRTLPLQPRKL
ncbi:rho GTPase-activating protein 19-like isoform X4 [Branchiostoma floridae]|uniref:Rho GTPase-activating protein 19-like isoform X4 n=1 Tax=Branchiostoma floridae TaxID=7739 RepID=A0A9J7L2J8_BRAFL|nr:rho GTPase-activating protein 19-like isoform X4 [Branchiostoma floridae]